MLLALAAASQEEGGTDLCANLQKMRRDEFELVPKPPEWAMVGVVFATTCVPITGCVLGCSSPPTAGNDDGSAVMGRLCCTLSFAGVASTLMGVHVMYQKGMYYKNVTFP